MSFNDHLRLTGLLLMTAMAGCGGGGAGTSSSPPPPPSFSVGGSVIGLVGSVSLQLNDIETLRVDSNGAFIFRTSLAAGANYVVTRVFYSTLDFNPQICSVSNSNGTVVTNVTDVSVNCMTPDSSDVTMISNTPAGALQFAIHAERRRICGLVISVMAVAVVPISGQVVLWSIVAGASPVLLESNDAGNAYDPKIAVDAAGNAVAVWWQFDGRTLISGQADTALALVGVLRLWLSSMGVVQSIRTSRWMPDGNALVVWAQSDGAHRTIWGNRHVVGSGWGTASIVGSANAGDAAGLSDVAMDASGNAIAVWDQFNGADAYSNIWANHYSAGAGWGTATVIGSGTSV